MRNGQIVHFEDNETFRLSVSRGVNLFSEGRHRVVGEAADFDGAVSVLDQIASGELAANVILLDGNLDHSNNIDAGEISNRIGELGLPVRVIGMSSQPLAEQGVTVDADLPKSQFIADKLVAIIDELDGRATGS